MSRNHFDVLIIGAGLSGVGAACHLSRDCPDRSFALIERRQRMGGTWDLFRYPGIRSDSDMYTLGYNFRPWTDPKVLADGPSIRQYIVDTAREYKIEDKIHYGLRMLGADFSTETSLWTVEVEHEGSGERETYTCQFLLCCTGYYNYDTGYKPEFPGEQDFKGQVIHPQHWPENLDYTGKKVVVIGSGATAVTLVPAMAGEAGHVTMLQRSPTYIATVPERDEISVRLRRFLPEMVVYRMARARNIALQRLVFKLSKTRPGLVRRALLAAARRQLGDDIDMKHFRPSYNPWDERLCAVPNGDLFRVLKQGRASIVTDHIETFTENGLRLKSGEELEADIVVSATGLDMQLLGGAALSVDGETREPNDVLVYKGVMLRDVPNMAMVFGYTNSSWTLKADLVAEYVCRLLNYMSRKGLRQVTPRDPEGCDTDTSFLDLQSGYIQRAAHKLPRQGSKAPWKVLSNYLYDLPRLRYGRIDDDTLEFVKDENRKRRGVGALLRG
ncbi:MAG: NAD(P)/FAD-dependent oxidoreductase [Alcanivorax sp.]|uniref:flavin-containing monooxygenase n=1 Tax=Alloalcanivorax marinus TaxID=1177169 RepID=UPI00195BD6EE|nr:NAD(P)/FAD-dependent oxidoreductase [Alloalcanivorax marinus]MBM7334901.1 NAD(P)/FAD-dependent oxidoreductase [Alloalcanivorax marinus]MCU5788234.1 monooxygenase flavin-binding family protein [Alloalcanivorax marinus]